MFGNIVRAASAVLAVGACVAVYGGWTGGKPIATDDGDVMRYEMDLEGGAKLYAIVSGPAVQAVHLVPNSDLGSQHWLYFMQEACRWDRNAGGWGNIVIGDRMGIAIPAMSWAADEDGADGMANALDEQLLATDSSAELLALFGADAEARSAFLPSQQMLDEETGLCAVAAAEGDNAAVGSVTLLAAVDDGSRAVDVTRAAAMLHDMVLRHTLSGMVATAEIMGADGMALGEATFEQTPGGVLIDVAVGGLEPGAHGIHLHRLGACSPDFTAASGHINPGGAKHGLRNPEGPDNGDLPLLHVGMDGSARAEFYTTRVSLSDDPTGDMPGLLDEDGSAVVIHADPDDHFTQPIGGSGGRVGCGVIRAMDMAAGM